jgi:hypothetical protein
MRGLCGAPAQAQQPHLVGPVQRIAVRAAVAEAPVETHRPQDDDTRGSGRWIRLDVGEVQIQADEQAILVLSDLEYGGVLLSGQRPAEDADGSVATLAKKLRDLLKQILVDLRDCMPDGAFAPFGTFFPCGRTATRQMFATGWHTSSRVKVTQT